MNTEESENLEQGTQEEQENNFDAGSFIDSDSMDYNENEGKENSDSEEEGDEYGQRRESNSSGEQDNDDYSDWSSQRQESNKGSEEEGDDGGSSGDEDGKRNTKNEEAAGWESVAESLGIDADDYESFIDTLKSQQKLAEKGVTNERIDTFNNLIKLDDESLMRKELKARGFNEEEIEDEIDILIENNTIRSKAREVRKELESIVETEKANAAKPAPQSDAMQQQELEEAREELETFMSKTDNMFGGKINSKQKEEHVDYISSGAFFEEVTDNPESMAQAAWLWKYKDQILKGMKSNGFEKGKSAILDRMTNPETVRKTNIPDPATGEFNPNRFLDSEQM
jgi:hypothetical protein